MEAYVGVIMPVAFSFAPRGWMSCQGQLLQINQNQALFSLIGTIYGGDGIQTFALPDLRGRVIVGQGHSSTGDNYTTGQKGGQPQTTLQTTQIPSHSHAISVRCNAMAASTGDPNNTYFGGGGTAIYDAAQDNTTMNPGTIVVGPTGAGTPVNLTNPILPMYYCINTVGVFPSRN
ncbi:MAG: tail fiber protein [Flavipsychrobacter sp.]|nr:tail fiber protein [Flavipsychrobacter sp.]